MLHLTSIASSSLNSLTISTGQRKYILGTYTLHILSAASINAPILLYRSKWVHIPVLFHSRNNIIMGIEDYAVQTRIRTGKLDNKDGLFLDRLDNLRRNNRDHFLDATIEPINAFTIGSGYRPLERNSAKLQEVAEEVHGEVRISAILDCHGYSQKHGVQKFRSKHLTPLRRPRVCRVNSTRKLGRGGLVRFVSSQHDCKFV
mmetsp:Transcript_18160/g.35673  ORF Transcript_18160/g.35673 Transcript_18160/m.35673 type:complete len:202 (-) Transcript_18160:25-630(-)